MTLTPKQSELWQLFSTANSILAEGGGRSGKTLCILSYIIARALRFPETDHLIGRLRFAHAKQSICFQSMNQLSKLDNVKYEKYLNKADWIYTLPNGSRLWIGGFDDKERTEKILGNEYATLYFNEASQIPYDTVETVTTRLNPPKGVPGKRIFDLNPPSKNHWAYKIFHERKFPDGQKVPENDYKHIRINPTDNLDNISDQYLDFLDTLSAAKRKRYKDGEYQDDGGTLWKRSWIQYDTTERHYQRIVIGVDPSGSVYGDEIGIVACGKIGNEYRILDDFSCHGTPAEWAKAVVTAYNKWRADAVIAESNFGGDMVAHTIRTDDNRVNVKLTHSSRGKLVRAEPISALYERGLVKHRKPFLELEDEYCMYTEDTKESPNRLDAAVFALTELSGHSGGGSVIVKHTGIY
jgi:hypothetical protein